MAQRLSDEHFAELIAAGDHRGAAGWLVRSFSRDVYALCHSMVRGDRTQAEDLAHDAMSSAIRALPTFRGESSPRTWLLSIARHRCLDHLRRQKREPFERDEEELEGATTDERLPSDLLHQRADAERALAVLSETERALVVLRFVQGLEHDELARAFGLREGTVRMRIFRALGKMRDELAEPVLASGNERTIAGLPRGMPARSVPTLGGAGRPRSDTPVPTSAPPPAAPPPTTGRPAPARPAAARPSAPASRAFIAPPDALAILRETVQPSQALEWRLATLVT